MRDALAVQGPPRNYHEVVGRSRPLIARRHGARLDIELVHSAGRQWASDNSLPRLAVADQRLSVRRQVHVVVDAVLDDGAQLTVREGIALPVLEVTPLITQQPLPVRGPARDEEVTRHI